MSILLTLTRNGTIPRRPSIATVKSGSLTLCAISLSSHAFPTGVCNSAKAAVSMTVRALNATPIQRSNLTIPRIRPGPPTQGNPTVVQDGARPSPRPSRRKRGKGGARRATRMRGGKRRIWAVSSTPSKGLAEADIDLDRRVGAALVQRGREVEAQRPKRRVISQSQADAVKQGAAKLRHRAFVVTAGIDKGNDADIFGDLDSRFEVEHEARFAADRLVAWVERTCQLVPIGADRAAAPRIDALVGRKFEQRRAVE